MNRPQNVIEIKTCNRYVTKVMGVTDLEEQVVRRWRQLRKRGYTSFIIKETESHAVVSPVCEK